MVVVESGGAVVEVVDVEVEVKVDDVLVVDASIVGASVDGALVAGPAVDDEQPSANRPAPPIAPPMKLRLDTAMPAKVRAGCERAVKDKRPSQSSLAPNRSVERRANVGQGEQLPSSASNSCRGLVRGRRFARRREPQRGCKDPAAPKKSSAGA